MSCVYCRWTGKCWYFYKGLKYQFDLEFEVGDVADCETRITLQTNPSYGKYGSCWTNYYYGFTLCIPVASHIPNYKPRLVFTRAGGQNRENVQRWQDLFIYSFYATVGSECTSFWHRSCSRSWGKYACTVNAFQYIYSL